MNQISAWSIRNPVPTTVLFLLLSLSGVVSFSKLRINDMPDIDIPAVTVSVARSGAAPTEMETQVARLIEDSVSGLGNVEHIRSTVNEGLSTTSVEFALGTDIDRATDDVRNAVASIRANLPADVLEPTVQRVDATGQAILTFIVDAPRMAPDDLSWFIDNDVAKAALSVNGVSRLERAGGVNQEIRVRLAPDRMMALGITASEISDQLKRQNVNEPGGRTTLGQREQAIRTLGSAKNVQALAETRLILTDGRTVTLSELGVIERSWAEPRQRARLDDREVIGFSVYRSVGTGEVAVTDAVRAKVASFATENPDVAIREVTSSTDDVLEGYAAAIEALLLGAALAVLVVWYFLRDVRATLISSVALPLSLLPTFGVMYVLNESLNNITLLAIALVVGILVDDAIVEIENIVRHMRATGKNAYEAAIEAADEIGLAVVATTFSIIAVFMPVGFMGGIPGQIFKSFAIAVCTSVFFSLVVARMLTPMMGAYLMKPHGAQKDEAFWVPAYLRFLGWTLRWRWITVFAGIAIFAASLSLIPLLPTDFIPATDRGRSVLAIEHAPGASLTDTDATVRRAIAILQARPEVKSVYAALGTQTSSGGIGDESTSGEVRKATVTVNLKPRDERTITQQEFEASVASQLAELPGARLRFGADGQSGAKVQVTLRSDDSEKLSKAVSLITREMQTTPGFQNAGSTASLARPELQITPKLDKAATLGVSSEAIAQTVNIATLGESDHNLPKFNLEDRQIPIRVMLDEGARSDFSRILSLQVPTSTGTVPLSSVADIELGAGPNQIDRVDRIRSATIEAEIVGLTTGQAEEIVSNLRSVKALPPGVTRQSAGDAEHMEELFGGFVLAMVSGIVLLLFVIALLFNNFIQPVTILTALPLSLGGAFGLMVATGTSLSLPALIGILMLMGIAAKNSILLVEYAIMARFTQNLERNEALIEAARKRARPIIMTTVAMGAGMLPLAFGIGADAEFRAPMAIAVIGGLLSSTALSLIYVPAVFTVMDDLDLWARRMFEALIQTPPPLATKRH
ncbi:efflux RND transporter permease subunit [Hyphomicrobium sp. LHD-15]|uniref:efflux RND transporter permease subunit n=1 Tax=Hyphomicrobium sp. LHD-15 TaxID=3072142 RepID=UPI00280C8A1D|nr:efflux RND transporter permease subunit [Hyphomicrobium sp. LHD-15]MDQ8700869.1 efflux RND transporter permease subunit [Hyphomicrobium sp. LHD-15]